MTIGIFHLPPRTRIDAGSPGSFVHRHKSVAAHPPGIPGSRMTVVGEHESMLLVHLPALSSRGTEGGLPSQRFP